MATISKVHEQSRWAVEKLRGKSTAPLRVPGISESPLEPPSQTPGRVSWLLPPTQLIMGVGSRAHMIMIPFLI